ncbi:Ribonuclease HI-related protein 2 [hydrothermal vent metagenome]|uniref:ribonuclease H n=1 Tax=hydrothermal vent metagenome TaxID=652676 RepID=A0A1W1C9J6_9ZZZZ
MKLTNELLELASHSGTLNKAQFELLGLSYPPSDNWRDEILGRELSVGDTNLLILLRGKLALTAQKQIISNYKKLTKFHNQSKDDGQRQNRKDQKPNTNSQNQTLEIYCDGACQGNPGKAGSGLAIYGSDKSRPTLLYGDYNPKGTNNTAELNALYKALLLASEHDGSGRVTILSDSKYSIDCITTWAYGWKRNGWKKKGGEIKNLDIIKSTHKLYEDIKDRVVIKHVKGHSGIEGNELADRMAIKAIETRATQYKRYDYQDLDKLL